MSETNAQVGQSSGTGGDKKEKGHGINFAELMQQHGVFFGLIGICIFFALNSEHFFTMDNFLNIMRQTSINAIIAVGMTYVIISKGIDLSVGSIVALAAVVVSALITNFGVHPVLAILGALLAGMVVGFVNGHTVAYGGIPAFISTLATMTIIRGIAFLLTNGYPIYIKSDLMHLLGRGFILGIPTPVIFMVLVLVLGGFLLGKTKIGRYLYAIGGNSETAKLSGINVEAVTIFAYVFTGLLAALSGVLVAARLSSGPPNVGTGFELDAIAACVLGGTSLSGGIGTIKGTLIGALLIGILNNGLNLLNVNPYVQMIIKGAVIFSAVYLSAVKGKDGK